MIQSSGLLREVMLSGVLTGLFLPSLLAAASGKSDLTQHHVLGPVRVFYTLDGESAVAGDDRDANGVPDQVEDMASQVWAAYVVFCEVLDFPDPMKSERYPGVNCFQVSIVAKDRIKGLNGVAYRMAQRARSIPGGKDDDRTLVMAVANTVDPTRNLTPAHELFHLIQYSTTYFGNSWYLEGMARWSERALGRGGLGKTAVTGPKSTWPQGRETREKLYGMKYEASLLIWNPIALLVDPEGGIDTKQIPKSVRQLLYSNGDPVLRDELLNGAPLMREILLELASLDDRKQADFHPGSWTLAEQNSADNDIYIYEAVMNVLRRHSPRVGDFEAPSDK